MGAKRVRIEGVELEMVDCGDVLRCEGMKASVERERMGDLDMMDCENMGESVEWEGAEWEMDEGGKNA